MENDFDLAIIGSGFGGSLLAMIARRLNLSVILLERATHPRFAIGESTSPLANLLIEQLAERYDLPRLKALASWGEWQRTYPEVIGGLKRGFTYFKHEAGKAYRTAADRSNQLLVAASPNDETADSHWLRSSVDQFLLREATALGAEYLDQTHVHSIEQLAGGIVRLSGERLGESVRVTARLLVDAGGPRGFLSRQLNIAETAFADYPPTQSLFSHFAGVRRCDEMQDYEVDGAPPYPMDDAAVHHVFDGGWMWVLRFNNGVTSAGVAMVDRLASKLRLAEGEAAWRRFLSRFPSIASQFTGAEALRAFTRQPRVAYRAAAAAGRNWAMLPSAAAFVDPLFSTGIPLTLLGIERLGRILSECFSKGGGNTLSERLREYGEVTLAEADHTAHFIGSCYAAFPRFEKFTAYSMFYFAAASYSEMARRLDRGYRVTRFLAADHAEFAASLRAFGDELRKPGDAAHPTAFARRIADAVDCLNIAGLCSPQKRNWYDVDLEDVAAGAAKLGLTTSEARAALKRIL
ncbi:MAG: NAD(P)/FAD-dependent oxidoreductase [Blastocatellia bacterium]